ncbi:MAG TPA: helix-hairpin-helix domain-containing protein [Thermodesulfobacteriota bacterium]|nr:helix-hairpin-helix domain-containing protein [Thermodesulfobacteriota bacterium]
MQNNGKGTTYSYLIMALIILIVLYALNSYRFCFSLNNENEKQTENLPPCLLEVKGEVPYPGLYYYAYCPTINELLNASGQPPDKIDVAINQNSLIIPSTGTSLWVQKTRKGVRVALFPLEGKKKILLGIPINLNTATADDLSSLPGIGPHIAEEVVSFRKTRGRFSTIEDLKTVKGIGEKRFKKIEKYLTVTTETIS